jgi:hypothetical protein
MVYWSIVDGQWISLHECGLHSSLATRCIGSSRES